VPAKNCPECGESMAGRGPEKHAITHWGKDYEKIKKEDQPEAYERIKKLVGGGE